MTLAIQRIAPRIASRPALSAAIAVVVALLAARWFAFYGVNEMTRSLWGPYALAPVSWLAAAGVAFYAYSRLQPLPAAEHNVERKTVLFVAGLVGLFLVSLQLVIGAFSGFGHSPYAHSPRWLAVNLLFAGATVVMAECARAALLRSIGRWSLTLALVVASVGIAAVQFTNAQLFQDGLAHQSEFWGAQFIPLAAIGLVAGFFILYGGLKAGLLVSAPLVAFTYYSPILPSAEWPIRALVGVAGPAMGLWIAEGMFTADEAPEESAGWFHLPSVSWVITAVIGLAIFWFSFGFFGFRPAFVPSHSMEPLINQGDVVLVGPVHADTVKVGDIVLYEMPNKQRVLHRVIAINEGTGGEREFTFKGDNNNAADLLPVTEKQLIGTYKQRVPKIGWVAIKFNQLIGGMH
jgi:signal peptidase